MNYRMVFFIIGRIIGAVGILMLIPVVCAIIYSEAVLPFIIPVLLCVMISLICGFKRPKNTEIRAKDGFICVAFSWIIMSLIGCLPFTISGQIPTFVDAFFETVSGFTTTGSSILSDVEALDKSLLLWRSLTQWIGGMGVLVFLLAVLPKSDLKNSRYMHLMKAEVPGPTVGKVVPKIADTARVMYGIYILLTVILLVFLSLGEMNFYEALCHSLTTASTGGFGVMNDSITSYSAYSQYVIAIFMLIFAINFNVYFFMITKHFFKALKSEELWWFLGLVAAGVMSISLILSLNGIAASGEESFRISLFQVASIVSTTGFSTADFTQWPVLAQAVLLIFMFTGGCAGCTAGGIKISRILLLAKNAKREIKYILHPRSVMSVKLEGRVVDHETIRGTTSYIIIYAGLLALSTLAIVAVQQTDLVTGFTSVLTCLNNVGPGLSEVGPASNFGAFSVPAKLILSFDMLAGRLELFPMLILFSPSSWKKAS